MAKMDPIAEPPSEDYYGFSLKSVCWGYRDIFRETIERLLADGTLGDHRPETTEAFFKLLRNADQSCYDHVLRRFLGAINPNTQWLLDLPGIFSDLLDLGRVFAAGQPHHGVTFFECLGKGGFGGTPEEVRALLTRLRRLREINPELALAFLQGYSHLLERLSIDEIDAYIAAGLQAYARNSRSGLAFMAGTLESSEVYISSLTRECRLTDMTPLLSGLLRALTGQDVEVGNLAELDSDTLLERGSGCVCLYRWLYLPTRVRRFHSRGPNRSWYKLAAVTAAAMLGGKSFPCIHGHPEYGTLEDLAGRRVGMLNLVTIVEICRTLRRACEEWPGVPNLLAFVLRHEFGEFPPANPAEKLLAAMLLPAPDTDRAEIAGLIRLSRSAVNIFDTVRRLSETGDGLVEYWLSRLDTSLLRPLSFVPDFLFPGTVSSPPDESLIADLKHAADAAAEDQDADQATAGSDAEESTNASDHDDEEAETDAKSIPAGYVYDEWSNDEGDYLKDYCLVHERRVESHPGAVLPGDVIEEGRRLSRVFERLKPDEAHRERYLEDGDVINLDRLVNYLHLRRLEPAPKIDFYEKPRINRRDLAVTILLDASGSTGENTDPHQRIIDIEKHAALILGQGLHTLGDRFAICGFSSNGRQNCIYSIYKDFQEPWEHDVMLRILGASPANSTRIGPALRHTGWRMESIAARQRLVILITDGRPMDTAYDPNTRYAQQDIRRACEENVRKGIHTFAISTEENSFADMEIMFPGRRFAILGDIRHLPKVLPRLYTRLTL